MILGTALAYHEHGMTFEARDPASTGAFPGHRQWPTATSIGETTCIRNFWIAQLVHLEVWHTESRVFHRPVQRASEIPAA